MSASAKVKRRSVAKALYVLSGQKYSSNHSESPDSAITMTRPLLLLGTLAGTFPSFRPLHEHGWRRLCVGDSGRGIFQVEVEDRMKQKSARNKSLRGT